MDRRTFLAAAPVAIMATPSAASYAEVYSGDTPLLRHLEDFRDRADRLDTAPDYYSELDRLTKFARLSSDMPVTSTADLAAKVLLANGDGRWLWTLHNSPRFGPDKMLLELRRLAGAV